MKIDEECLQCPLYTETSARHFLSLHTFQVSKKILKIFENPIFFYFENFENSKNFENFENPKISKNSKFSKFSKNSKFSKFSKNSKFSKFSRNSKFSKFSKNSKFSKISKNSEFSKFSKISKYITFIFRYRWYFRVACGVLTPLVLSVLSISEETRWLRTSLCEVEGRGPHTRSPRTPMLSNRGDVSWRTENCAERRLWALDNSPDPIPKEKTKKNNKT